MALLLDRLSAEALPAAARPLIESMRGLTETDQLACRRLSDLLRSVKAQVRQDGGGKTPTDLARILDDAMRLAAAANKSRVTFVQRTEELGPVECDGSAMGQVFLNLLVNAAQAIEGTGTVTATLRRDGGDVLAAIEDTGAGIPAGIRDRILEGHTTKPAGLGTGLGLVNARRIVEQQHGGQLTFETELGKGTTFFVRIPVRAAAEPE
jgi:signal transduction histidine kinase